MDNPYANIPDFVWACSFPEAEETWPILRARGLSPRQVIDQLKVLVQMELDNPLPHDTLSDIKRTRDAKSQLDHPEALKFVAAKLGAF